MKDDVERLARIAVELTVRVRDYDPETNGRWLRALLPEPADWFRLAFVLAAAVPDDRSWNDLTAWAAPQPQPKTPGLQPCGTPAAAARHRANHQPVDEPCLKAERAYYREIKRNQRARKNTEMEIAA